MTLPAGASLVLRNSEKPRDRWRRKSFLEGFGCFFAGFIPFATQLESWGLKSDGSLPSYYDRWSVIDYLVGIAACLVVGPMHKSKRGNAFLLFFGAISSFSLPVVAIALIRLGRLGKNTRRLSIVAFALLSTSGTTLIESAHSGWSWGGIIPTLLFTALGAFAFTSWGRSQADEAQLVASLRERAETATRELDALARESVALERSRISDVARVRAEERTAIARDMHDNLSHHLSLISLHAGALAYRDDLTRHQIQEAARTLQDAARAANEDLRDVLLALRTDGEPAVDRNQKTPLPTSETVLDLISDAKNRRQHIQLELHSLTLDDFATLSPNIVAALHRILTELLNNARKYAPNEVITLRMAKVDDLLVLRSQNPTAPSTRGTLGTGMGLVGLEERARLVGGGIVTRNDAETYSVEVHLPWRSKEQA